MNSLSLLPGVSRLGWMLPRGVAVLLWTALVLLASVAAAQVNVFPGGGGVAVSGQHTARVTVGQAYVGSAQGTTYTAAGGFQSVLDWRGPSGGLPPAVANSGDGAIVTAVLSDDGLIRGASLFYRVGGDTEFTMIGMDLDDPEADLWAATIPAVDVSSRGVQYYVAASDGVNVSFFPAGAPTNLANLTVVLTDHPVLTTTASKYGMYGLRMAAADESPLAVFDELGAYDKTSWRLGIYSPTVGDYLEGSGAGDCSPGQGFWLITKAGKTITASGTATPLSNGVFLPLERGFNQIANPYDFPIAWSDVYAANDVDNYLYAWNGSGYDSFSHATLAPGLGYWVVSNISGKALVVPPVPAGDAKSNPARSPEILASGEEGWSVNAVLSAGEITDGNNRFGVRVGATADRDAFDFLDAPPPPGEFTKLSLLTAEGKHLLSDYRDPTAGGQSWDLILSSNTSGVDFRVDFQFDRPLPSGWRLLAIDPGDPRGVDLSDGHSLKGQTGSENFAKTWRLAAGDDVYLDEVLDTAKAELNQSITSFSLRPAYPNPFGRGSGTLLAFTAPRATQVALRVYDVRGRVVKTLYDGAVEQGLYQFDWLGRDDSDRRAASGVYFVRLTSPETNLIRKVMYVR